MIPVAALVPRLPPATFDRPSGAGDYRNAAVTSSVSKYSVTSLICPFSTR
jgi:hypothetical protein